MFRSFSGSGTPQWHWTEVRVTLSSFKNQMGLMTACSFELESKLCNRGLYGGLYTVVVWGLLRRILGVDTMPHLVVPVRSTGTVGV